MQIGRDILKTSRTRPVEKVVESIRDHIGEIEIDRTREGNKAGEVCDILGVSLSPADGKNRKDNN